MPFLRDRGLTPVSLLLISIKSGFCKKIVKYDQGVKVLFIVLFGRQLKGTDQCFLQNECRVAGGDICIRIHVYIF